jgi:prefoldin subunit 5
MTVSEMIEILEKMDQDKEVQVFASGEVYIEFLINDLSEDNLGSEIEINCDLL